MKCALCQVEIFGVVYLITRVDIPDRVMSANICKRCVEYLVGQSGRNNIDRALIRSGWVQDPLPFHELLVQTHGES